MVYYIAYEGGRDGPFDLLGIIRKIRNGTLQKHHLVNQGDDMTPKPAYQHADLYDIFIEQDKVERELAEVDDTQSKSFYGLLKAGFLVLKEDQAAAILTGTLMLALFFIIGGGVMGLPVLPRAILVPILGYMLFALCVVAMLRVSRVQLLSLRYFVDMLRHHGVALLRVSLPTAIIAFTIPWLLADIMGKGAWVLSLIAGMPVMAYLFYMPLLVTDRGLSVREAFCFNHQLMHTLGIEFYFLVLGMLMVNLLAFCFVILPLLVLPATLIALMILYDHHFNSY
jgi:hypothetical protein